MLCSLCGIPVLEITVGWQAWISAELDSAGPHWRVVHLAPTHSACRWGGEPVGRQAVMPGSTFLLRTSKDGGEVAWCYLVQRRPVQRL